MRSTSENFIFKLAKAAEQNIADGYYEVEGHHFAHKSLKGSILGSKHTPVIAEIKFTSPAEGTLRKVGDVRAIAQAYERGGVSGISVLTEPRHFDGDIEYLPLVKGAATVPVLMKDIVIDPLQIDAGAKIGADAILLIVSIFTHDLAREGLDAMLSHAHSRGLEVLLEAHTEGEYRQALAAGADVVGINNRDLETLEVSLETSKRLLRMGPHETAVISESGIESREQILELTSFGASGFLVGSALMKSRDLETKVRALTGA